jgi:hypothetical protein
MMQTAALMLGILGLGAIFVQVNEVIYIIDLMNFYFLSFFGTLAI